MKVVCKFNDPFNLPSEIPNDFDFGLEIGKEYIVMGMRLYDNLLYYLVDENGRPNWFPRQIFDITESKLDPNWHFSFFDATEVRSSMALWGFYELCCQENFHNLLLERDEQAMFIYFKRKVEKDLPLD